jgi:hypothetical protein
VAILIWGNKRKIGKLNPEITNWTCREYYTWNGWFKYSVLISHNNYRFQESKKFPFASVANVTQTILATPPLKSVTFSLSCQFQIKCQGLGGSMSLVVGLSNNSYKPITNTAWVHARLCKLQKTVFAVDDRHQTILATPPLKSQNVTWRSSTANTVFCNLQSRAWTHAVLVIGLYELLDNPTTKLIEQNRKILLWGEEFYTTNTVKLAHVVTCIKRSPSPCPVNFK